jgi:RHS repeat-associated protein
LATYDAANDATTIANHRIYDSYGNLESQTNAAVDCLFGYTGRLFDSGTGLQNNLNRWYDPSTGSWTSQDPMSFAAGDTNLYRYVGNSPTNAIDPTGTDIYLKTGNNTGNPINDAIHQSVCVDIWDSSGTKKIGVAAFSFGQTGWSWTWGSTSWLGWNSITLPGFGMKGTIYETGDCGTIVRTKNTTVEQDRAWLEWMRQNRVRTEDVYSVGRHNCRKYSQAEFENAPGTEENVQ